MESFPGTVPGSGVRWPSFGGNPDFLFNLSHFLDAAKEASITDQDRKYIAKEHIEMGMRFMAKDMKKYALTEFGKAIELLDRIGDKNTKDEVLRQVKKLELEVKLEESQRILLERKRGS